MSDGNCLALEQLVNGYGLAAQFVLAPWVEAGGSYARGFTEVISEMQVPQLNLSGSIWTYGGFLNAEPRVRAVVLGFGALWERLYFKFVLSHANNRVNNAGSGTTRTTRSADGSA
jgi:hypothetical protein